MAKNIMVVQSRATGRFLLKKDGDLWTFPSVIENDHNQPVVYMAMEDVATATGQDVQENDWLLDFVTDPIHQVFHVWVHGEPKGEGEFSWESMLTFPYPMADITNIIFRNTHLMEKVINPDTI